MLDMSTGDVLRLTSLRNNFVPDRKKEVGLLSVSFKAPKGEIFVAVFLGVEPKDGSAPLDIDAVMNMMGWFRKE